ncbi:MAG: tetratricopeptide repeat protein [Chlorobi bacterium]|nr:tetratricopeptide repeat protein [Chlorobiota bacterium]
MYKKLIFGTLSLFFMLQVFSQEVTNTITVDEKTYTMYLNKQWKELVETGKLAKKKNIDFYYLQYRMGVAYYELNNYRKAIPFFEKVLILQPQDKVVQEYLYYSYLLAGREDDARILANKFTPEMRDKLKLRNKDLIVDGLGLEYEKYLFDDYSPSENPSDTIEQRIRKDLGYFNLSLTHHSRKKFTLNHSFSYLLGNNLVYNPEYDIHKFDETVKQFQYYISGSWNLNKGSKLKLGFHYVNTKLEALNPDSQMGNGNGRVNDYYLYFQNINSIVGFATYSKSISYFNLKASTSVSNLGSSFQVLPLVGVDYFPFGNTNLVLGSELIYQSPSDGQDFDPGLIVKQKIGVRLFKSLWVEPFMQYGKVTNFVDNDASVIYNNPDILNNWYGVNLNLNLSKKGLTLYFIYQQYSNTNSYKINESDQTVDYNSQTFLGGLKWKF